MSLIRSILRKIFPGKKKFNWKEIEYFDDTWKNRIAYMSQFIPETASVTDLGCGKMWLKEMLPHAPYYPVDYVSRGEGTIVCDFNKKEFPSLKTDVIFVSGCIEYVLDYEWFINRIAGGCTKCIISYCTLEEYPNLHQRRIATWVNHLKAGELVQIFSSAGMSVTHQHTLNKNTIFVFEHRP